MYSIEEIKALIVALDNSSLTDLEITSKTGEKFSLRKKAGKCIPYETATVSAVSNPITETVQPTEKATNNVPKNQKTIDCPMVGVFYTSSSPDAEPYVTVGSRVVKGDVVCIIEAMKLMNEVTATQSGVITEVLVANGDLVEYGQPLFVIE